MQRTSFETVNCSIAQCLEAVGEWWTLLIVRDAFLGVTRFDDLQQRLGISRNVLSQRLDHLVEHGILERRPYQERPVRHDYRLTAKGRALWPVLTAMREWGDEFSALDGPPVELVHRTCGHIAHVDTVCSECGEPIGIRTVTAVAGPAYPDSLPPAEMRHAGPGRHGVTAGS